MQFQINKTNLHGNMIAASLGLALFGGMALFTAGFALAMPGFVPWWLRGAVLAVATSEALAGWLISGELLFGLLRFQRSGVVGSWRLDIDDTALRVSPGDGQELHLDWLEVSHLEVTRLQHGRERAVVLHLKQQAKGTCAARRLIRRAMDIPAALPARLGNVLVLPLAYIAAPPGTAVACMSKALSASQQGSVAA